MTGDGYKGIEKSLRGSIAWANGAAYGDECKKKMPKGAKERKAANIRAAERVLAVAQEALDEARNQVYAIYEDNE